MLRPQLPDHGCFLAWPQTGHGWMHPSDVPLVRRLIPSVRVFRRERFDGVYYHLRYGRHRIRLRPCLWRKLPGEGIEIGDQVETVGVGMQRELLVGRVREMLFDRRHSRIVYRLVSGDRRLPVDYSADQLRVLTSRSKLRPSDFAHRTPRAAS